MKEFIEYIVKNLVDQPDAVNVHCYEGERGVMAEVRVASSDVGKVVGRGGKTINALRTIAMMACARLGRRIRIELIEEAGKPQASEEATPPQTEEMPAEEQNVPALSEV